MNYTESKQKLDKIRNKYSCTGEVLFRTAIQVVVENGQNSFRDEEWCDEQIYEINYRHSLAEAEGKILFMTRDFEIAIFECAKEIAEIEVYDFLNYLQLEVDLGGTGLNYPKAILHLLKQCVEWIEDTHRNLEETYDTLQYIGFDDDDIQELGFEYILDAVYPEGEEE